MNLLAHSYLARYSEEWVVGAILGDFVKGSVPQQFPSTLQQSLRLHRRIDSFTDQHPLHEASRRLIHRSRRRYAGVMVDVFYDHFLARRWSVYSLVALPKFTQYVYQALRAHAELLPSPLLNVLPKLIASDRLLSYRRLHAIRATLASIGRRFRQPVELGPGIADLIDNYHTMQSQFDSFFPLLEAFCEQQIRGGFLLNNEVSGKPVLAHGRGRGTV